jgi:hypothetical protein
MPNQRINIVYLPLQDFGFVKGIMVTGASEGEWKCSSGED